MHGLLSSRGPVWRPEAANSSRRGLQPFLPTSVLNRGNVLRFVVVLNCRSHHSGIMLMGGGFLARVPFPAPGAPRVPLWVPLLGRLCPDQFLGGREGTDT